MHMASKVVLYGERDINSELRNLSLRMKMAVHVQLPRTRTRKISHYDVSLLKHSCFQTEA